MKLFNVCTNKLSLSLSLSLAKCYHQSELSVLITSHLKSQTDARIKITAIRRPTNFENLLFELNVLRRVRILHMKHF